MGLIRTLALGAAGYWAFKALKRKKAESSDAPGSKQSRASNRDTMVDDGARTTPHGDPVLVGETIEVGDTPATGAHSSRGFGGS